MVIKKKFIFLLKIYVFFLPITVSGFCYSGIKSSTSNNFPEVKYSPHKNNHYDTPTPLAGMNFRSNEGDRKKDKLAGKSSKTPSSKKSLVFESKNTGYHSYGEMSSTSSRFNTESKYPRSKRVKMRNFDSRQSKANRRSTGGHTSDNGDNIKMGSLSEKRKRHRPMNRNSFPSGSPDKTEYFSDSYISNQRKHHRPEDRRSLPLKSRDRAGNASDSYISNQRKHHRLENRKSYPSKSIEKTEKFSDSGQSNNPLNKIAPSQTKKPKNDLSIVITDNNENSNGCQPKKMCNRITSLINDNKILAGGVAAVTMLGIFFIYTKGNGEAENVQAGLANAIATLQATLKNTNGGNQCWFSTCVIKGDSHTNEFDSQENMASSGLLNQVKTVLLITMLKLLN